MNVSAPEFEEKLTDETFVKLEQLGTLEDVRIDGDARDHLDALDAEITGSEITNSELMSVNFTGALLRDVTFDRVNLSTMKLASARLTRVVFRNCRLQGADFNATSFVDVTFENCHLDLANFSGTQLRNVDFINCPINESNWGSARLKHVSYVNCLLEHVTLQNVLFMDTDMTQSHISQVDSVNALRGLRLTQNQIIGLSHEFAHAIGIKVVG